MMLSGRSRGAPPILLWVKKDEKTERRKPGWANKIEPGHLPSSKTESASEAKHAGMLNPAVFSKS